jgi:hypothetical protein
MKNSLIDDNKKVEYEHDALTHEEKHGSLTLGLTFISLGILFMIGTLIDMRVMNYWPLIFIATAAGIIVSIIIRFKRKHR